VDRRETTQEELSISGSRSHRQRDQRGLAVSIRGSGLLMMNRRDEVRRLLGMTTAEVRARAGDHLLIVKDLDALHRHFAESIASEIRLNNNRGRPTKLVLPVGPVGQYPLLAEIVNDDRISLKQCWFFMMDEHCDDDGLELPADHPLSLRRTFQELFVHNVLPELMVPGQLIFPDHRNIRTLKEQIAALGGIDTTYGGIGIHGHIAYNEPEPGVRESDPRVVHLNDFTRTINAMRAEIGGNLESYPGRGLTLGMRQLLGARRIRLYCRNGLALDWANTVLRLALFGQPGDDYPVTYIRDHHDYMIVTDEQTACPPRFVV
jgi:glucosamine-6-phosphate deaminase